MVIKMFCDARDFSKAAQFLLFWNPIDCYLKVKAV